MKYCPECGKYLVQTAIRRDGDVTTVVYQCIHTHKWELTWDNVSGIETIKRK